MDSKFFIRLFTLFILSLLPIPDITAQVGDYPIFRDTLIIGDTIILKGTVSDMDPEKLECVLIPYSVYDAGCQVCNLDSIRSFRTEWYSDSTFYFYFYEALGTIPGRFNRIYMYEGETYKSGHNLRVYTPPFIFQQPVDVALCGDDTARITLKALGSREYDLEYDWYRNGELYSRYFDETLWPQEEDTGSYYCVVFNSFGSDTSSTVRLKYHPANEPPGLPSGPQTFCPGTDTTRYYIGSSPYATGYTWKLEPANTGTLLEEDTTVLVTWDPGFTQSAEIYVELSTLECGTVLSEKLKITVPGISPPAEICIVGIDQESGKFRIVWEKPADISQQPFSIYRESNEADVYLEIGTVNPGQEGLFIDSASTPDILPHRYRISYIDSCGDVSELSAFHQTMHLSASLGILNDINLNWTGYMGIPFPAYDIYRGTHPDSITKLRQVPSTVTSFTDDDPPDGMVWYQISITNPAGCNPQLKSSPDYSSSRSNIEQVNVIGIGKSFKDLPFSVYPNPANSELFIHVNIEGNEPYKFFIYNLLGNTMMEGAIRKDVTRIDIGSLVPGLYVIKTVSDSGCQAYSFCVESY